MLDKVYKRLRDIYSCTLNNNSDTKSIEIDVGFNLVLTVTHEARIGLNIFKIVSNRGSRPVYISSPNNDDDLLPLYGFIEDFSSLL